MNHHTNPDAAPKTQREVYKLPMGWYWIDHSIHGDAVGPFLTREDAELDAQQQATP